MSTAIVAGEPGPLSRQASAALRSGPFHRALDLTIRDRGLTLDTVHRRLAAHGAAVSLASLSYWRNGHRRPGGGPRCAPCAHWRTSSPCRPPRCCRCSARPAGGTAVHRYPTRRHRGSSNAPVQGCA